MQPRGAGGVKIRAMTQIQQQVQLLTIEAEHEGQRIDNFLKTQLKGVPKSLIYRILRKGEVRVNKKAHQTGIQTLPGRRGAGSPRAGCREE